MKKFLILLFIFGHVFARDNLINLFIAANYLAENTLERFEHSCNCRLEQNYFNENDEMLAKMAAGANGYDVIVPTSYAVDSLIKMGKLRPLDYSKLPNFKNIDPRFLNQRYDLANRYSIPYAYDNVMLAYNKKILAKLGIVPDSWAVIFEPRYLKKLKGRVTVLNSQKNVFAAALLYLHKDPNSTRLSDLEEARKLIERAKPYWAKFDSDTYYRSLLRGDIWLAMSYSIDIFKEILDTKASHKEVPITAQLQQEGNMYELDNLVITKTNDNLPQTYQLFNFLLSPQSAIELANETGASIMNLPALKDVSAELKQTDWIYPPDFSKMHSFINYDPKTRILINEIWLEILLS